MGALVRESWEAHHGIMCVGVNWERQGAPAFPFYSVLSLDFGLWTLTKFGIRLLQNLHIPGKFAHF